MLLFKQALVVFAAGLSFGRTVNASSSSSANPESSIKHNKHATNHVRGKIVPGAFVIQVNGDAGKLAKRGRSSKDELHAALRQFTSHGIKYKLRQEYLANPEIFNGASVRVDASVTESDLLKLDGVERVWPVRSWTRPRPPSPPDGPGYTRGRKISAGQIKEDAMRTSSSGTRDPYAGDYFGPHADVGVDKAIRSGQRGKGVKIVVIDDGVDYKNPILGGCFGSGCRIAFGKDFVGDDYDGETNSPIPDNDPYTDCSDHGTHTTGTLAALPNKYGFLGAAPESVIGVYRVFSCLSVTNDEIILSALTNAARENVDIVSMSISGNAGWLDASPTQYVANRLAERGMHMIFSTGNDGNEGLFLAGTPAATRNGVAVASTDVNTLPTYEAKISNSFSIGYMSALPFTVSGTLPLYFVSKNSSAGNADACTPFTRPIPNGANSLVVIQRGGCTFVTKFTNLAKAGARYVFVYNSEGLSMLPDQQVADSGLTLVAGLTRPAGIALLNYYNSKSKSAKSISFPGKVLLPSTSNLVGVKDEFSGGLISDYSSYGPTFELFGQPTFAAPGKNIISTVPLNYGGVGIMQGTSMSTPLAAGATAILISDRKNERLSPKQVKSLFVTTANRIPTELKGNRSDTILLQGGGMMNLTRALQAKTLISPYQFQLNDTKFLQKEQTLTLTNINRFAVTYSLSGAVAETIGVFDHSAKSDVLPSLEPQPVLGSSARLYFSARKLTIPPGQTRSITIKFIPPKTSSRFPFYSGYVLITGRNGKHHNEFYSVPYFGLAAKMFDLPILDTTNTVYSGQGPAYPFLADEEGTLLNPGEGVQRNSFVAINTRLAAGTRKISVDLVDENLVYRPTLPATNPNNNQFTKRHLSTKSHHGKLRSRAPRLLYKDVPIVGGIFNETIVGRDFFLNGEGDFPFTDLYYEFNGTITPGKPGGEDYARNTQMYKILVRALKITGDPDYDDQYESWLSPKFQFTTE